MAKGIAAVTAFFAVVFVIALLFMMGAFKGPKSRTGSAREGGDDENR